MSLISDNKSTNHRFARLGRNPFIGCNSHKLNLEDDYIIKKDSELSNAIYNVLETMREAKQLKNSALLRNITDFEPVMHNKTRCSGTYEMLKRFLSIREELLEVRSSADSTLPIGGTLQFHTKVKKFKSLLSEIDIVAKSLQTKGYTLAQCRDDLEVRQSV